MPPSGGARQPLGLAEGLTSGCPNLPTTSQFLTEQGGAEAPGTVPGHRQGFADTRPALRLAYTRPAPAPDQGQGRRPRLHQRGTSFTALETSLEPSNKETAQPQAAPTPRLCSARTGVLLPRGPGCDVAPGLALSPSHPRCGDTATLLLRPGLQGTPRRPQSFPDQCSHSAGRTGVPEPPPRALGRGSDSLGNEHTLVPSLVLLVNLSPVQCLSQPTCQLGDREVYPLLILLPCPAPAPPCSCPTPALPLPLPQPRPCPAPALPLLYPAQWPHGKRGAVWPSRCHTICPKPGLALRGGRTERLHP